MLWQSEAAAFIEAAFIAMPEVSGFCWKGSYLTPDTMDGFSDLDLDISFTAPQKDACSWLDRLFRPISPVLAFEHHRGGCDVLRVCLENGWRFDLSCHPGFEENAPSQGLNEQIACLSHRFWFAAVCVCIRLGRGDHLISSHLVLGLWREILVLHMLVRDEREGTGHHRFGGMEDVGFLRELIPAGALTSNRKMIIDMLRSAASSFRREAAPYDMSVLHKTEVFLRLCDEWTQ